MHIQFFASNNSEFPYLIKHRVWTLSARGLEALEDALEAEERGEPVEPLDWEDDELRVWASATFFYICFVVPFQAFVAYTILPDVMQPIYT